MGAVRIASGLRLLRENAGLSQKQVAAQLGITEASYSRWEAGQVPIRVTQLETLRALFGTSWGTFFEAIGMPISRDYQPVKDWLAERQLGRLHGANDSRQNRPDGFGRTGGPRDVSAQDRPAPNGGTGSSATRTALLAR